MAGPIIVQNQRREYPSGLRDRPIYGASSGRFQAGGPRYKPTGPSHHRMAWRAIIIGLLDSASGRCRARLCGRSQTVMVIWPPRPIRLRRIAIHAISRRSSARRTRSIRRQSGGGGPSWRPGGLKAACADPGMPHTDSVAHPTHPMIQRIPLQE